MSFSTVIISSLPVAIHRGVKMKNELPAVFSQQHVRSFHWKSFSSLSPNLFFLSLEHEVIKIFSLNIYFDYFPVSQDLFYKPSSKDSRRRECTVRKNSTEPNTWDKLVGSSWIVSHWEMASAGVGTAAMADVEFWIYTSFRGNCQNFVHFRSHSSEKMFGLFCRL